MTQVLVQEVSVDPTTTYYLDIPGGSQFARLSIQPSVGLQRVGWRVVWEGNPHETGTIRYDPPEEPTRGRIQWFDHD